MQIEFKSNYPDSLPHNFGDKDGTIHFYIDNKVYLAVEENHPDPIALMVEPRSIFPEAYAWLEKNWKMFKYIFYLFYYHNLFRHKKEIPFLRKEGISLLYFD